MNSKVTIKDIAKVLGISFSTVAKALHNDPVVSEKTRERVKEKAKEMKYYPNRMAIGLRSNATRTIGMVLNDLENPTRSYIIKKISTEMIKHGFISYIFDSSYNESIEMQNILNLISHIPEGVIVSPVTADYRNIKLLQNLNNQVIILSSIHTDFPTNYVHMDHVRGGYIAAHTLLAKGHKRNLLMIEPLDYPSGEQFYQGVLQAYKEFDLKIDPDLICFGYPSIEHGMNLLLEKFDAQKERFKVDFSGVVAFNDMFAIGVYKAVQKLGLRIPEDLSVIGYDDHPMASLVTPQLTTLYYPKEEVANLCIEILISKLIKKDPKLFEFNLEPKLIMRDSVKNIN